MSTKAKATLEIFYNSYLFHFNNSILKLTVIDSSSKCHELI